MNMLVHWTGIRHRRYLLIVCLLIALSAFIFSYINVNATTNFTHKPKTHKIQIHEVIRDSSAIPKDPSVDHQLPSKKTTIQPGNQHFLPDNKNISRGNPNNQRGNQHYPPKKQNVSQRNQNNQPGNQLFPQENLNFAQGSPNIQKGKLNINRFNNSKPVLRKSNSDLKAELESAGLRKEKKSEVIPKGNLYDKPRKSFNGSFSDNKIGQKSKDLQGNIRKQKILYDKEYRDIVRRSKKIEPGVDEHTGHIENIARKQNRSHEVIHANSRQNRGFANPKNSLDRNLQADQESNDVVSDGKNIRKEIKSAHQVLQSGRQKEGSHFRKDTRGQKDTDMTIAQARDLVKKGLNNQFWDYRRNFHNFGLDSKKHDRNIARRYKFMQEESPDKQDRPESCNGCMNLDFQVLSNPKDLCKKHRQAPELLILIASDPKGDLSRTAVRRSWGKVCNDTNSLVVCAFMVGTTTDRAINQQLSDESAKYQDIIIFSNIDSYRNLTYKTVMGLKWALEFCKHAKYVMKTDQDVYVNTRQIPTMLQAAPSNYFCGGFCWGISLPHRGDSKWRVSRQDYAATYLPKMCSGTGYILSRDVLSSILEVSPNIPFVHLEDVYVALCLEKIGVIPIKLAGFNNMRTEFTPCSYRYSVMTSHRISEVDLIDYWEMTDECPPAKMSPESLYSPLVLEDLI